MASKPITLKAEAREKLGTRATRRFRQAGKLPAVVYGHQQANVNVAVEAKPFRESLAKGAHLFELSLDGKAEPCLVKDVEYDHLGTNIIHVDFARVDLNERVTVTVAIELKGDAPGEKEGGVTQQVLNEIEVECLVTEIPSAIVYNIGNLKLDESVHVKDLTLPAGVTTEADPELIVAVCHAVKEEVVETPAAEGEPEVIGKPAEGEAAAAAAAPAAEKK
ncbi:MAG: 50S ribosomal protein L25 [Tepidisphaeraceae bacterium]